MSTFGGDRGQGLGKGHPLFLAEVHEFEAEFLFKRQTQASVERSRSIRGSWESIVGVRDSLVWTAAKAYHAKNKGGDPNGQDCILAHTATSYLSDYPFAFGLTRSNECTRLLPQRVRA